MRVNNKEKIQIKNVKANFIIFFLLICAMIAGLVPLYQVRILGDFIDYINNGNVSEILNSHAFVLLLIIIGCYLIAWINNAVNEYLLKILEMSINETQQYELLGKCKSIYLEDLENNDFYNVHKRVIEKNIPMRIMFFRDVFNLITIGARLLCTVYILYNYERWISGVMLILVIPVFIFSYKAGVTNYIEQKELTQQERTVNYLSSILTSREHAYERKLFNFSNYYNNEYDSHYEEWKKKRMKIDFINLLEKNIGSIISVVMGIFIFLLLLTSVIKNNVTVGTFISIVYMVYELSNILSDNLISIANQFAEVIEYSKERKNYLQDHKKIMGTSSCADFEKLEFNNVSFKYTNTDRYVLKNFNLSIEKGKKYALVGLNGEGKTTIVKLALGLYSDYEGMILLNGKNIQEYSREELNRIMSVLFQDFAKYSTSIRENIWGSKEGGSLASINGIDGIELNALIDRLPDGIDTEIGKISEQSIDLSGGEWQKIAFARVLAKDSPVIILDEPTAALDPIIESKLYALFYDMTQNKTSIVISHRLGATKLYDNILVLSEGNVAESGTHDELIERKGLYYHMYESQKEWYL